MSKLRLKSFTQKLILSYLLIIMLFLGTIISINVSFLHVEGLYQYNIQNTVYRTNLLMSFKQDFTEFRRLVQVSFLEAMWDEYDEQQAFQDHLESISLMYSSLQSSTNRYIYSVLSDIMTTPQEATTRIENITAALTYAELLYYSFTDLFLHEQNDILLYPGDTELLAERATARIEYLLELAEQRNNDIESLVEATISNTHRLTLATTIIILALMLFVAHRTTRSFSANLRAHKNSIQKIALGNFDDIKNNDSDEISMLISDISNTFQNLISSVHSLSENTDTSRINADDFSGVYRDTALSINSMIDKINDGQVLNKRLQLFMDYLPVVITMWADDYSMVDCNEEAARRYGFLNKEEYKRRFGEVSPEYQPDGSRSDEKAAELIKEAFERDFLQFEWMHQDIHGELIPSEILFYRYTQDNKKFIFSYALDLRELKKSMQQAVQNEYYANIAAENSMAKSRFLATMSHEIRTPINAVLGISEIQLARNDLPLGLEEVFAKIFSSSHTLLNIVNDILDLSKIEAGKMEIFPKEYEVASFISDVVQLNIVFLGSKKLEFILEVDETLPVMLVGDELRVRQVLNNIISNAFKYTEKGHVRLSIERTPHEDEGMLNLNITVRDTGMGMSKDNLEALFNEYARFHEAEVKFVEGTGLGMPIVHNLLKIMDGSIEVKSEIGLGTSVHVVIPQAVASSVALGKDTARNLESFKVLNPKRNLKFTPEPMPYGRVLVVDDVESNLYVARGLMNMYDLQIETLKSGMAAIEKLITEGNTYDIVFMDHMMPGMTGIEATLKLRSLGYVKPIVAFTANAIIGQAEEFMKNGFDGFISKPINSSHLDSLLKRFVKNRQLGIYEASLITGGAHEDIISITKEEDVVFEANMTDEVLPPDGFDFSDFDDDDNGYDASALDPEIMAMVRAEFLETQLDFPQKLAEAMDSQDLKHAHLITHSLKGIAGLLGADTLAKDAELVEKILKVGGIPSASYVSQLEASLESVIQEIKRLET